MAFNGAVKWCPCFLCSDGAVALEFAAYGAEVPAQSTGDFSQTELEQPQVVNNVTFF
jgi:hypothetical protein